jgi:RimJ/RimL family protein N-acetyltransferase
VPDPHLDLRHVRTERLWLDLPTSADVDALHAFHADPETWRHFPSARFTERAESAALVTQSERQFAERGLGVWSVRDAADGPVVGRCGCSVPDHGLWWNLYYRFSTTVQRRGYAAEAARAALDAAHAVDPDLPVVAFLLEHNTASRRTAESLGMSLAWRGPDRPNPDPDAVRLVYVDREPTDALVATIDGQFRAG